MKLKGHTDNVKSILINEEGTQVQIFNVKPAVQYLFLIWNTGAVKLDSQQKLIFTYWLCRALNETRSLFTHWLCRAQLIFVFMWFLPAQEENQFLHSTTKTWLALKNKRNIYLLPFMNMVCGFKSLAQSMHVTEKHILFFFLVSVRKFRWNSSPLVFGPTTMYHKLQNPQWRCLGTMRWWKLHWILFRWPR